MWRWIFFSPQLRSTQRCITPASSLSPTLLHCASWSWPIFRYVTSCGFSRFVIFMVYLFLFFKVLPSLLLQRWCLQLLSEAHTFPNRYLATHQWCRGSGGPCSARFPAHPRRSPPGLEPVRFAPRSNRSEPGARQLACWWWCSLCLHSAICPSAPSISWKGNHASFSSYHKNQRETNKALCFKHLCFS